MPAGIKPVLVTNSILTLASCNLNGGISYPRKELYYCTKHNKIILEPDNLKSSS